MKMTKQNFETFAGMFKQSKNIEDLKILIVQYFKEQNSKFNEERFLLACGSGEAFYCENKTLHYGDCGCC